MFNVTLSNNNCIFDSKTGFLTIEEAMEWARGRGRKYHVMIENPDAVYPESPLVKDYWINYSISGKIS